MALCHGINGIMANPDLAIVIIALSCTVFELFDVE